MRSVVLSLLTLLALPSALLAQCDCGYPTRCSTPCPRCAKQNCAEGVGQCQQPCTQHVYVKSPCPPENPTAELKAPPGNFVAPPRTGNAIGETRSLGLELPSIYFPPLNLRLPTIQIGSLVRSRRDARMMFDEQEGPFAQRVMEEATIPQNSLRQSNITETPDNAKITAPPERCSSGVPGDSNQKAKPVTEPLPPAPEADVNAYRRPNGPPGYDSQARFVNTQGPAPSEREAQLLAQLQLAQQRSQALESHMRQLEQTMARLAEQQRNYAPAAEPQRYPDTSATMKRTQYYEPVQTVDPRTAAYYPQNAAPQYAPQHDQFAQDRMYYERRTADLERSIERLETRLSQMAYQNSEPGRLQYVVNDRDYNQQPSRAANNLDQYNQTMPQPVPQGRFVRVNPVRE